MGKEVKSAFEIAMEKLNKVEDSTEAERNEWKYVPEGEQLGVQYIKEEFDLAGALNKYSGDARKYVSQGIAEVLIRNIILPKTEAAKKTNKKAMDGIKLIKNDKAKLDGVYGQIKRLFDHYATTGEQQRQQARESIKEEVEMRLQQAAQQQGLSMAGKMDIEKTSQFQGELRKLLTQLDAQYLTLLTEYKSELMKIT